MLEGNGVKGFSDFRSPRFTNSSAGRTKFLTTPPNGLGHRYATLGFAREGVGAFDTLSATLVYHRFESSRLNIDYGSELDLQLQLQLASRDWPHQIRELRRARVRNRHEKVLAADRIRPLECDRRT